MPDPNPNSCGRHSHWIPVCGTNKMSYNPAGPAHERTSTHADSNTLNDFWYGQL